MLLEITKTKKGFSVVSKLDNGLTANDNAENRQELVGIIAEKVLVEYNQI